MVIQKQPLSSLYVSIETSMQISCEQGCPFKAVKSLKGNAAEAKHRNKLKSRKESIDDSRFYLYYPIKT